MERLFVPTARAPALAKENAESHRKSLLEYIRNRISKLIPEFLFFITISFGRYISDQIFDLKVFP